MSTVHAHLRPRGTILTPRVLPRRKGEGPSTGLGGPSRPRPPRSSTPTPPNPSGPIRAPLGPAAQRGGHFKLTHRQAKGGLGRAWRARDTDLNRDVALKEILPDRCDHPEMWRRFLKEAQVTGQLEHPNIVPVYELARRPEDDQPFYTMRLVRGRTLSEAIAQYHRKRKEGKEDPLDRPKLLQAFVQVCLAVGYAHSR